MQMPDTEVEWRTIAQDFENLWNFPMCIGALDGKHVNIRPPHHSGSIFYNYKHFFSIVLMALVDAKYRFLYCDVGCNGQVSDGGVFAQTSLQDSLSNKTANIPTPTFLPGTDQLMSFHIVADEAFPLREDIMKPYHNRNAYLTIACHELDV